MQRKYRNNVDFPLSFDVSSFLLLKNSEKYSWNPDNVKWKIPPETMFVNKDFLW